MDRNQALRVIKEFSDTARFEREVAHELADDVLCKLLEREGYEEIVDVFKKMDKWYA